MTARRRHENAIRFDKDSENIVTITLRCPGRLGEHHDRGVADGVTKNRGASGE